MTIDPITAIGPAQDSDWKLEPLRHAGELPPEAGTLKRVLERPETTKIMGQFTDADREAVSIQATFVNWSRLGFWCRFLSIVCGTAALLEVAGLLPAVVANLGFGLQYAFIAGALVLSLMISVKEPFEHWMRARATAENARLELFRGIVHAVEPARAGELPLLPLQLEYFRRYMLDAQRRYYRKRGSEHARAAGKTKHWQYTLIGLSVVSVIVAALVFLDSYANISLPQPLRDLADAAVTDKGRIIMLAGGIIASALGDLTAALSLSSLDRRNAARYLSNADNLDFLSEKYLKEARAAAASGDPLQTQYFIDLVSGIISSEHREWIMLRDLAKDLSLERFAKMRLPGKRQS